MVLLALQSEASRLNGLGIMGAIVLSTSLLGMVLISYYVDLPQATDPKPVILLGDELRTAITISFIFVFFGLLAYGESIQVPAGANCPCLQSITKSLLDNYWLIVSAIIAFYFSGKVIENTSKKKQ